MRRSPRQRYPYFPGDPDPFINPLQGLGALRRDASVDVFAALQRLTSTDPLRNEADDLPSIEIPERPTPSIPPEPEDDGGNAPPSRPPLASPFPNVEPGLSDQDFDTGVDERIDQLKQSAEEEAARLQLERRREAAKLEAGSQQADPAYAKAVDDFEKYIAAKSASGGLPAGVTALREQFRRLMRQRFGVPDLENDDAAWEDHLTKGRDENQARRRRQGYGI
jgi:hypothetical protein